LEGTIKNLQSSTADCRISAEIHGNNWLEIEQFISEKTPWILPFIRNTQKDVNAKQPSNIQTHYITVSSATESKIRSAMISFIRNDDMRILKVQITSEERPAFGLTKDSVRHEVKYSAYGLGIGKTKVISSTGNIKKVFHKFNKQRLLSAIVRARATQNSLGQDMSSITNIIGGAKNLISGLADGWKSIADAFKTIKKEEIKERITGEGFAEYNAKSRYIRSIGIPKSYWETYKKQFMDLTGVAKNPIVKPEIETLLKMADFIQDNAWNTNDFTFDMDKGGSCSNFVCMTRFDSVIAKYHIMATVVDGTFQLAPNIWIYSKYSSIAGGIVETTKVVTKRVPRSITQDDVKAVNAMMLLTSINIMQENFGMPKTLPEFSEMMPTASGKKK